MRIWLALLAAPSLALACQAVLYALVTPSCSMQTALFLHGISGLSLVLTILFARAARIEWTSLAAGSANAGADSDLGDPMTTRVFLSIAGTAVAALSGLTIAAMWIGVWVLSPCWS